MATIERYETKGGATLYRVRYRTPDNRSTQKRGFKRKIDAQRWANSVEVDKMTGEYIAPSLGRITVAELGPEWLTRKKQHTTPSHYRMLESAWRVHVPRGGGRSRSPMSTCSASRRVSPAWEPRVPVRQQCCGRTGCYRAFWPTP
jgi:hypothetical protein